jgi:Phage terminase, small subunit
LQQTTYSNKSSGQKATSQAIEKSAEYVRFSGFSAQRMLFRSSRRFSTTREAPMPRKSANEIELATITPAVPWTHERPDPPQGMPEAAAAVWRDAVASMKARHFSKETHALLARYCHAMAECERLETELDRIGVGLPSYDRLSQRLNSTASTALAYARALRLTPKSNLESRAGGRDPHRTIGPKPWDFPSVDDTPRKPRLWER